MKDLPALWNQVGGAGRAGRGETGWVTFAPAAAAANIRKSRQQHPASPAQHFSACQSPRPSLSPPALQPTLPLLAENGAISWLHPGEYRPGGAAGCPLVCRPLWLLPHILPGRHVRVPDISGGSIDRPADFSSGYLIAPALPACCCTAAAAPPLFVPLPVRLLVLLPPARRRRRRRRPDQSLPCRLPPAPCRLRRRSCRGWLTTSPPASLSASSSG